MGLFAGPMLRHNRSCCHAIHACRLRAKARFYRSAKIVRGTMALSGRIHHLFEKLSDGLAMALDEPSLTTADVGDEGDGWPLS